MAKNHDPVQKAGAEAEAGAVVAALRRATAEVQLRTILMVMGAPSATITRTDTAIRAVVGGVT